LTTLKRFLCDQFDRSRATKRGGQALILPLDDPAAEAQLSELLSTSVSPEALFDRAWAETVVQTSVDRLEAEYQAQGRRELFNAIKDYRSDLGDRQSYGAVGRRLGMSVDAVATAVVRLRRRYRAQVRAEVSNTVATPAEIDQEMRYLIELLAV
jgi:RNA polymerase sigma-70 factor (ECF subfamily)